MGSRPTSHQGNQPRKNTRTHLLTYGSNSPLKPRTGTRHRRPFSSKKKPCSVIQFPPEMDKNWVRYGLAKLGQISRLPNWQRMLFCAYTTQLLHSTVEVCWNNNDSYFIWFEFVCRNSGQIASRRSWKRSCLGLEYTSKCSRLALLWEPN